VSELTVLFDGHCGLCRASVNRLKRLDRCSRIEVLDLHDPSAQSRFPQINREEAMRWMQAVDPRGRIYSGVDAWARIGLTLPGWKLIAWLLLVPGVHFIARKIYEWVARNRYRWNKAECTDGTCALHAPDDKTAARNSPPHAK